MTAHELARYLLEKCPDLPVVINGWGSDEGSDLEVTGAAKYGETIALGHGVLKYPEKIWIEWGLTEPKL